MVCRIINERDLEEAHQCLIAMIKIIDEIYGPKKISPNLHLSLHICEYALDYGPLHSIWCFSFEWMNGLLDKYN